MIEKALILILTLMTASLSAQCPSADQNNPNYLKCTSILKMANKIENQASDYLKGNKYSDWNNRKRLRKSRSEYLKAIKVYRQAKEMNCVETDELNYKIIYCLNQIEQFNESEKILKSIIDKSQFNSQLFQLFFMTVNKKSGLKTVRENGRLLELCGESPDAIDSEYFYTKVVLKNASKLYKDERYELLLNYLSCSNFRINWSKDARINDINYVLIQLFLSSLLQTHKLEEIGKEFNKAKIKGSALYFDGIGETINFPKRKIKLFHYWLNIYDDKPSRFAKYHSEWNSKPIIDTNIDDEEDIKDKTIFKKRINELLSRTLDKK